MSKKENSIGYVSSLVAPTFTNSLIPVATFWCQWAWHQYHLLMLFCASHDAVACESLAHYVEFYHSNDSNAKIFWSSQLMQGSKVPAFYSQWYSKRSWASRHGVTLCNVCAHPFNLVCIDLTWSFERLVSAQLFACCGCTQGLSNSRRFHKKHKPLKLLERDSLSLNIVSTYSCLFLWFCLASNPVPPVQVPKRWALPSPQSQASWGSPAAQELVATSAMQKKNNTWQNV